jgi:hypothetical protein
LLKRTATPLKPPIATLAKKATSVARSTWLSLIAAVWPSHPNRTSPAVELLT